jgi:hypothetical protein
MVKTRKSKKGILTIPELRKAFDHMESFTSSLVKRTRDPVERRKAFQKEWAKVFYRSVNDKSADAYLQFEAKKRARARRFASTPLTRRLHAASGSWKQATDADSRIGDSALLRSRSSRIDDSRIRGFLGGYRPRAAPIK